MIYNFTKVTNGLFRGSAPSPEDVSVLKNKYGINKIVSLDQKSGNRIDRVCKLLNIQHVMVPIDETKQSLINLFSYNIKDLLLDDGPSFIHCLHGKDRTGLVVAIFKCKYMGMNPGKALAEAKSLGFGTGVDAREDNLFERIILKCKPTQDNNSADIVSQERSYLGDNRDSYLDQTTQKSFAPYLDTIREYPYDYIFDEVNEQSPTRENYVTDWSDKKKQLNDKQENLMNNVPQVGQYDNAAGMFGTGPVFPAGGFLSD